MRDSERVLALSEGLYPLRLVGRPKIWERRHWDFLAKLAGFDGAIVIDSDRGVVAVGVATSRPSQNIA